MFAKCQVRWSIIAAILTFSDWIRVHAEKLVNAPKSHKIEYAPMHTIQVITRLAYTARRTDRASASSWLLSPASIVARRVITLMMRLGTYYSKGFSNRDITISYLYMNAPLNFFNELSMSKH